MSKHLEHLVINWAEEKGILTHATPFTQFGKTREEIEELWKEIEVGNKLAIEDELGDVLVTLVIQAEMWGLSATECLMKAYAKISQRKGKMENGVFKKEGDSE